MGESSELILKRDVERVEIGCVRLGDFFKIELGNVDWVLGDGRRGERERLRGEGRVRNGRGIITFPIRYMNAKRRRKSYENTC